LYFFRQSSEHVEAIQSQKEQPRERRLRHLLLLRGPGCRDEVLGERLLRTRGQVEQQRTVQVDFAVSPTSFDGFISSSFLSLDRTVRGNVSVTPHAQSVVAQLGSPPEWVIFGEIFLTKDSVEMREVSKIDPLWLVQLAEHYYSLKM